MLNHVCRKKPIAEFSKRRKQYKNACKNRNNQAEETSRIIVFLTGSAAQMRAGNQG